MDVMNRLEEKLCYSGIPYSLLTLVKAERSDQTRAVIPMVFPLHLFLLFILVILNIDKPAMHIITTFISMDNLALLKTNKIFAVSQIFQMQW